MMSLRHFVGVIALITMPASSDPQTIVAVLAPVTDGFFVPDAGKVRLRLEQLPEGPWRLRIETGGEPIVITDQTYENYRLYETTVEFPVPRAGAVTLTRDNFPGVILWESFIRDLKTKQLFPQGGKLERFLAAFRADPANANLIAQSAGVVLVRWASPGADAMQCSGVRVAKRLVLTNRHCLPKGFSPASPIGEVTVRFGEFRGSLDDVAQTLRAKVLRVGSGGAWGSVYLRDLAVLQLDAEPADAPYASAMFSLALDDKIGQPSQLITVWQYDKPFNKAVSRGKGCALLPAVSSAGCAGGTLKHYCEAEEGSSGSPIVDPATGQIVALHFSGIQKNAGNCALGAKALRAELSGLF